MTDRTRVLSIEPDRDENVLEAIRSAVPDVGLSPTEVERIYDAVIDGSRSGYWLAYHGDWSGFVACATEIEALRYAVDYSMSVAFVRWGEEPRQVVRR